MILSPEQLELAGARVLMRVDFNVPLDKKTLLPTDLTRIRAAMPTIEYVLNAGASLVLCSHLGRPQGAAEDRYSLSHIVSSLESVLNRKVRFVSDCISREALEASADLQPGSVLLLENVRFHAGEESGDPEFAAQLAKHGNCYINDAFGTAHREHASTATIARYYPQHKAAGFLMKAELDQASKVLNYPSRPFTAIMGGAKVSDKLLLIENMLSKVDRLLIVGGMAYTFCKAMGGEIGSSLCENDRVETARALLTKAAEMGVDLVIPVDSVAADTFSNEAPRQVVNNNRIPQGWMGLDLGPESIRVMRDHVANSKTLLWNGPAGVFEFSNFQEGTRAMAQAVADATSRGAFSLIGGGDSAAAVHAFGFEDQVSYVSTGGGALLELLEGQVLPGVKALEVEL
ncbi:MAG: phosphoglycerate kinase [Sphingomonadales bacterium]|nr:phosphoglycerate kinase [Sphingomonadales bacterium]MBM3931443.1 phosphoglycerate kinase [Sphingomonadales bacterium]